MSHNDESFFREVEEDYRRDQTIKFFQAYGAYFIAGAFVILALVGGYTFQQNRRAHQAAAGGDALSNAILLSEAGKQDEAQKALAALAENGPGSYKIMARLHAAAESVAKNKLDAAKTEYAGVANDEAAPEGLRNFARVQLASISMDNESYDTLARDLESLRSGNSRWRFSAKEILGLSAYKEGKFADAERLFGEIASDGEAPQAMRQQADVMLTLLLEKQKAAPAGLTGKKDTANDTKTQ
ncbi:MAG: tetratricopeptide repeat protein [Rhodomicrobium sp.]